MTEAAAARRQEDAAQRGQTGRGAVGRGERAEDLHRGRGVHDEPGRLLALRVREERVPGGRQHAGLRSALHRGGGVHSEHTACSICKIAIKHFPYKYFAF